MKYVQKYFLKEYLCVLQVFLCALVSPIVCARPQLTGNIDVTRKMAKYYQKSYFLIFRF